MKSIRNVMALVGLFAAFSISALAQMAPATSQEPTKGAPAANGGVRAEV
jgi:hypothetical protein